jgi:uncharacterized protein DUF4349
MNDNDSTKLIERDLHAVDEALARDAAGASDPAVRELQELALALRADSPEADPAYAERLRERARQGFPPEPGSARARLGALRLPRVPRLRRPPLALLGGFAAALLALAVAVPLLNGRSGDDTTQVGSGGAKRAAPLLQSDSAATAESDAPKSVGRGGFAPGGTRKIERSASLTLAAPGDELDRVAERIDTVTDRYGGFVLRSDVSSGDEGASGGSFELRIPQSRIQPALRDLAALGDVRSRGQSGQDVTREYVTARDRLQAARAERKSLLRRLANAQTDAQAEAIRRRLDLVAGEIRGLRSQLRNLRLRTDYVAVSVSLVEKGGKKNEPAPVGSFRNALDDALGSLVGAVALTLRVLGVALPLALIGLLAWFAARLARRRRRESVLA